MGSFFLQYGKKCYTTIQREVTIWPIVFSYQIQNNEDILPNIYSLSQFDHRIEDDKMSYELIEYQDKKIISSKNYQWKWDLCHSEIIFGFLCRFWIVSINEVATISALKGSYNAQKCAYLVSLSPITMMTLFPSELAKAMINSIEISTQCWLGMNKGCRRPGVSSVPSLFFWKTKY